MNKRISTLLLTAVFAVTLAGAAYAEEPVPSAAPVDIAENVQTEAPEPTYYPTDIELRQDGEQILIVKRYTVPADTAVSELKETDLTRMSRDYVLWGVSETRQVTTIEEAELSKTLDVAVPSNIPEEAVAALQQDVLYDKDGYFGTLHLVNVTCTDEMREDGTYPATANYTGTVTRKTDGDLVVELIYAPVSAEPTPDSAAHTLPAAGVLAGGIALLVGVGFAGYCVGKKHAPNEAAPAADTEEKPKVYVPANDIVVGAHQEDEDE